MWVRWVGEHVVFIVAVALLVFTAIYVFARWRRAPAALKGMLIVGGTCFLSGLLFGVWVLGFEDGARAHRLAGISFDDNMAAPDCIAESYLQLHRQHRSTWAFEVVVRPWVEKW
jgi:hypothetical protein